MSNFWKCAAIRALRTFCQSLLSTIPAGATITPVMIQTLDWSFLYVIAAWVGTALLAAFLALVASVATGLPEVDYDTEEWEDEDDDD